MAKYLATMEDEIKLEQEYKIMAENLLRASYEQAVQNGTAGTTKLGNRLIEEVFDDVNNNIKTLFVWKKSKRGALPTYAPSANLMLDLFKGREEDMYMIVTMTTMNVLVSRLLQETHSRSVSSIENSLAQELMHELKCDWFLTSVNKKRGTALETSLKKRSAGYYKRAFMLNLYRTPQTAEEKELMTTWPIRSHKEMTVLAAACIEQAVKGSGFFEYGYEEQGTGKNRKTLKAVDWLEETWRANVEVMAHASYRYPPMIVQPRPWEKIWNGGYYDILSNKTSLLRVDWTFTNSYLNAYRKRLETTDMSFFYDVVNHLQSTAFTINVPVLEIMEQVLRGHGGMAGIDSTEPIPPLPMLQEPYTDEELKNWKYKASIRHRAEVARKSRLLRLSVSLGVARKYANYAKIYFPWNMDYRGRLYPIPTELNPQGDGIQKALLLFAEPTAVEHESAEKWFLINGANLAGVDKVSFEDRIAWTTSHEQEILDSADDPMSNTFWADQDDPWLFLAYCFEYKKYKAWMSEHGTIVGFKTGIPFNYDGTCSGLQHFSMLLRDEIGGQAVNLVPQETVSDIYGIVAKKINPVLTKDAVSGTEDDFKRDKKGNVKKDEDGKPLIQLGTKTLAQQWLMFARAKFGSDGITRKVCKRSVMTLAYGSGRYGFSENLLHDIIRPWTMENEDNPIFTHPSQAAQYMGGLIWDKVSTTVVKAVEGMKFLQELAQLITTDNNVVQWTTPNGLLVQQNKYEPKFETMRVRLSGVLHRVYIQENPTDIDKRGQVQAIAPNFIHSMDASHMQRVIHTMQKQGIKNMFMIHDSFGTDLNHAEQLYYIIRTELVGLYADKNYLQDLTDEVNFLIKDTQEIPVEPAMGKLHIEDIQNSKYCFA